MKPGSSAPSSRRISRPTGAKARASSSVPTARMTPPPTTTASARGAASSKVRMVGQLMMRVSSVFMPFLFRMEVVAPADGQTAGAGSGDVSLAAARTAAVPGYALRRRGGRSMIRTWSRRAAARRNGGQGPPTRPFAGSGAAGTCPPRRGHHCLRPTRRKANMAPMESRVMAP